MPKSKQAVLDQQKKRQLEKEKKVAILAGLVEEGRLKEFNEIFNYIDKKYIHKRAGINYNRLLRNIKRPQAFKYEDATVIARVLKVNMRNVSDLIINQIEARQKK